MSEREQGPEVVAAEGEAVAADPFWSVVRRRHPDVDVVVLPSVPGARRPSDPNPAWEGEEADAEAEARHEHEVVRRAWEQLVADSGDIVTARVVLPVVTGRWLGGSAPDRVRREASAVVEDLEHLSDPLACAALLRRAEATLRDGGWHVVAPTDGLPRLMAGRPERDGRREVLLVHAPAQGRLVLRTRGPELAVGAAVAHACVVSGG